MVSIVEEVTGTESLPQVKEGQNLSPGPGKEHFIAPMCLRFILECLYSRNEDETKVSDFLHGLYASFESAG